MKFIAFGPCAALLLCVLAAAPVMASEDLAKQKACLACHQIDKKLVGPAYKDIAAKYKTDKDAEKKLAAKVRAGSTGVWGQIPMPANPSVSEAEAATLVKWILAMK